MEIDQIIDGIYRLPQKSKAKIKESIIEVIYPKSHILLKANRIEFQIYFIKRGIVRAYADREDNQITFWFGKEGDTILSMKSYVEEKKGYENIELLEECELYQIQSERLKELYNEDIYIANWGRKFAELLLIQTEGRLISRQFRSAPQRYKELLDKTPHLVQRVQLSHIASYLGITQVSLSRIRGNVK